MNSYFLPALGVTVGEDDGSLRRAWEDFAASVDVVPHRCNGVTRWRTAAGELLQRITFCVGPVNDFRFLDEVL